MDEKTLDEALKTNIELINTFKNDIEALKVQAKRLMYGMIILILLVAMVTLRYYTRLFV